MQLASPRSPAFPRETWPQRSIASRRFLPAVSVEENVMENDDIGELWRKQPGDGFRMSSEDIRSRIDVMDRKLRRRAIDLYLLFAAEIAFFGGWMMVRMNALQTAGGVLTIIGISYLGWQVRANRFRSLSMDASDTLEHLRRELVRQRDFHWGSRFWW